jgi:ATP-dependent Clp protease, protease subunit
MYIHSPGGSVTAGLSIYDTMAYIRSPVSTVCLGQAASMGSLLLAGGEKGKRYALPHSSVMIHQPLGGTQGPASDILIYANQIQRTREQVNEIYRKHLNAAFGHEKYGLRDIEDMMERDKYLTAQEAKDLGIVDEIMVRRAKGGDNKGEASSDKKDGEV